MKRLPIGVAAAISDRCPSVCWAELVTWSLGWGDFTDWTFLKQRCNEDTGAYCGKCYSTGRLREFHKINARTIEVLKLVRRDVFELAQMDCCEINVDDALAIFDKRVLSLEKPRAKEQ